MISISEPQLELFMSLFQGRTVYYGKFWGSDNFKSIYFDANYNFVLFKNDSPICSIGFNRGEKSLYVIEQIQGVRGKNIELSPFRWEKMLVQIMLDWAKFHKIKKVGVIRGESSPWYCYGDSERQKRLHMKYDVTATRMGFKLDPHNDKIYSLTL